MNSDEIINIMKKLTLSSKLLGEQTRIGETAAIEKIVANKKKAYLYEDIEVRRKFIMRKQGFEVTDVFDSSVTHICIDSSYSEELSNNLAIIAKDFKLKTCFTTKRTCTHD